MSEYDTIRALEKAAGRIKQNNLLDLFEQEPNRVEQFGVDTSQIRFDFSRQKLDADVLQTLLEFARSRDIAGFLQKIIAGEPVNPTEGRAAQHMALRADTSQKLYAQGELISKTIADTRANMKQLAEDIRSGKLSGAQGRRISHIVHIGIGGSDLGPKLVAKALHRSAKGGINLRFVANVDPAEINDALSGLDPAATLVFVVSKSFSTTETLANARVARAWLQQHLGADAVKNQMFAITARTDRAETFGVDKKQVFGFADWVGGRFSLWSSVGLSLVAGLGPKAWDKLLAGAASMDAHVLQADFAQNAPVVSALISFWNLNFLKYPTRAIIPYASRMALLPLWMQQLVMESNGKSVQIDGTPAKFVAAPVIFGDAGTNSQHAFFQALHQAPNPVPVDFIGFVRDAENNPAQHQTLLANMLGQASALMTGKTDKQNPHKNFTGDRPSTTILMDALSPFALGELLAFYEHETVILAHLCNINPFDQWGVELGKQLAQEVEARMNGKTKPVFDLGTENLLQTIQQKGAS